MKHLKKYKLFEKVKDTIIIDEEDYSYIINFFVENEDLALIFREFFNNHPIIGLDNYDEILKSLNPDDVNDHYNLLNMVILKIIDLEKFSEIINGELIDLKVKDNKLYMVVSNLSELKDFFKDTWQVFFAEMMSEDGYDRFLGNSNYSINDIYLDKINDENLRTIWDYLDKNNQLNWKEEILEGSRLFGELERYKISDPITFEDFKNLKNSRYFSDLLKILDNDDIIIDCILQSYDDAQDDANYGDAYKECLKPIENFFGKDFYEWDRESNKYLIKIDESKLLEYIKETYNMYMEDYQRASISSYIEVYLHGESDDSNPEPFDINEPQYGFSRDINDENLNDILSNNLYDELK